MASIASKDKKSVTIRNSEGKQLFYEAINPNQEIVQNGIIYNNTNGYMNDNAYPNELYDIFKNGSAVFSRYINLKKNLLIGNGFEPVDKGNEKLKKWLKEKNKAGQDKDDILEMVAFDMSVFEGAYLQLVYDRSKKPTEIYFTDFNKLRAREKNDLGYSETYAFSRNWGVVTNQRQQAKMSQARNQPEFDIQAFNPNDIKTGNQILPIMSYNGTSTYPTVSYNAVIPYIKLAYQLGVYELNRALQGFLPSTIVYVVGINGEDEQKKYVANFEDNFVGTNKSKVLFMFGENTDAAPKVESLNSDASGGEGVFEKLIDICNSQITIAMSGSMPLSGIEKTGQQLGGGDNQLFLARENYMSNVIVPTQKLILKKFNMLCDDLLGLGQLTIVNTPLHITQPTAEAGDTTRSERRYTLWGLEPLPEDEDGAKDSASVSGATSGSTRAEVIESVSLNGAQISSLLDIITKVSEGALTLESAKALMKIAFPSFTQTQVDEVINNLQPKTLPDNTQIPQ